MLSSAPEYPTLRESSSRHADGRRPPRRSAHFRGQVPDSVRWTPYRIPRTCKSHIPRPQSGARTSALSSSKRYPPSDGRAYQTDRRVYFVHQLFPSSKRTLTALKVSASYFQSADTFWPSRLPYRSPPSAGSACCHPRSRRTAACPPEATPLSLTRRSRFASRHNAFCPPSPPGLYRFAMPETTSALTCRTDLQRRHQQLIGALATFSHLSTRRARNQLNLRKVLELPISASACMGSRPSLSASVGAGSCVLRRNLGFASSGAACFSAAPAVRKLLGGITSMLREERLSASAPGCPGAARP